MGTTWGPYAAQGFECGALGPPVKDFEFLTEFGAAGQWFEFGALYFKNGAWRTAIGNYGQTAGRLTADVGSWPEDAEMPTGWDWTPPEPPAEPTG